jgi:hypothetical protein
MNKFGHQKFNNELCLVKLQLELNL